MELHENYPRDMEVKLVDVFFFFEYEKGSHFNLHRDFVKQNFLESS